MLDSPLGVGVIIPAHNAERYLAATIESVLAQTRPAARVVVVDDGSTDRTREVALRFAPRVTLVAQENQGVSRARNRGAAAAGTAWLAFLDSDDLWRPEKLERQAAGRRGLEAVLCGVSFLDEAGKAIEGVSLGASVVLKDITMRNRLPIATPSTLLVSSALFSRVGGYDPQFANMADWDLLLRLRLATDIAVVDEPLVQYRRHPGQMSRSVALLEAESGPVLDKLFSSADLPSDVRALETRARAESDMVLSGSHFRSGNTARALRFGWRALRRNPRLVTRIAKWPQRVWRRRTGRPR